MVMLLRAVLMTMTRRGERAKEAPGVAYIHGHGTMLRAHCCNERYKENGEEKELLRASVYAHM